MQEICTASQTERQEKMEKLSNPQKTIEVIKKYDFAFQKKFGQNFLIDAHVLNKIIASADITKDDCVLEIGPGIGTMTQYLAEAAGKVVAVEIDRNLIPILSETLADYENVTVINEDVLKLDIAKLTHEDLSEIEHFLFHEREFFLQYPQIYEAVPYSLKVPKKSVRKVKPYLDATGNPRPKGMPVVRGQNTVTDIMTRFRSFMIWAIEEGYAQKNPFKEYRINESVYGKPIYISVAERKKIHETDMSDDPVLEQQKNVFVLQCLIGCRVGDYYNMTYDNLIGNAIEYIPSKTRNDRVNTIRVPLTETALEIINRYRNLERKTIMPFVAQQTYNVYIKKVFLRAGITRTVTVINQQTRQEEQRPIYEIASSHMARRTFIGNIYKNVKDPNLVGALSGHKEGSKAFARYRDIDEDMKKELVNMLE